MKLQCKRCDHSWDYKGKALNSQWKNSVSCPICKTTVTLKKNKKTKRDAI